MPIEPCEDIPVGKKSSESSQGFLFFVRETQRIILDRTSILDKIKTNVRSFFGEFYDW